MLFPPPPKYQLTKTMTFLTLGRLISTHTLKIGITAGCRKICNKKYIKTWIAGNQQQNCLLVIHNIFLSPAIVHRLIM